MFLPFWNLVAALFAWHMLVLALQKLGLVKSK